MNLQDHKEILLKWVSSCQTFEQLELIQEVIREFITKRFEARATEHELNAVLKELADGIVDRKILVVHDTHVATKSC